MTTHEMLAAVIYAYARGGDAQANDWWCHEGTEVVLNGRLEGNTVIHREECSCGAEDARKMPVIALLLSPEGLKAAYRRNERDDIKIGSALDTPGGQWFFPTGEVIRGDNYAAHTILDSWLSGGAEAAIKTAFFLLPNGQNSL